MTRTPTPTWAVIAHNGTARGYWHTLSRDKELNAIIIYRENIPRYTDSGGIRLLDEEGKVLRFAGPLGRPGKDLNDA